MLVALAWILSAVFSLPILVLYEEKLVQGNRSLHLISIIVHRCVKIKFKI